MWTIGALVLTGIVIHYLGFKAGVKVGKHLVSEQQAFDAWLASLRDSDSPVG